MASVPLSIIDTATLTEMDRYRVSRDARWLYVLLPLLGSDSDRTRFSADPEVICASFFTADAAVTPQRVERWLGELQRAELVRVNGDGHDAVGTVLGRLGGITRRVERARQ